jgi:hypothetical protein
MKLNRIAAAGTAIALAFAWASAPLAQVAASAYTAENVAADNPFGALPVDPATVDLANLDGLMATLTEEQQTELTQRCVVIAGNGDLYAAGAVALCEAIVAAAEAAAM